MPTKNPTTKDMLSYLYMREKQREEQEKQDQAMKDRKCVFVYLSHKEFPLGNEDYDVKVVIAGDDYTTLNKIAEHIQTAERSFFSQP